MLATVVDSRDSVRVHTRRKANLSGQTLGQKFELINLSAGGALACGPSGHALTARLRLRLSLGVGEALPVMARVVRAPTTLNGVTLYGLAFEHNSGFEHARLQHMVGDELRECLGRRAVGALVVDRSQLARQWIQRSLARFHIDTHAADSPVQAFMHLMRRRSVDIGTVFVGAPLGSCTSMQLCRFLGREYPEVTVVLIVRGRVWYNSLTPRRGRGPCIHVLYRPWSATRLASYVLLRAERRRATPSLVKPDPFWVHKLLEDTTTADPLRDGIGEDGVTEVPPLSEAADARLSASMEV